LFIFYNGTYTLAGTFDIGFSTANIRKLIISNANVPNKYRMAFFLITEVKYYELIVTPPLSFIITLIQNITINTAGTYYSGYLTMNSLFLLVTTTMN